VLDDRVSFKKGCYLGQEIVARIQARGHPKQVLVAIKFESKPDETSGFSLQPVTGAEITLAGGEEIIGQVTSSALSPSLSSSPVAFAQIKFAHLAPGTVVTTLLNGLRLQGTIQPTLGFALTQAARRGV